MNPTPSVNLFELLQKQIWGDPIFFVLASLVLISALAVVLQKNLVRAGFTLIGCFGALALVYFALGAELVAASQILIYAVGITLVVIFAIMLLSGTMDNADDINPATKEDGQETNLFKKYAGKIAAFVLPVLMFILISYSYIGLSSSLTPSPPYPQARMQGIVDYINMARAKAQMIPTLERVGEIMLSEQILAFELVSILLLIAFVGAIVLSKRKV
ncbi:MAG: NADH-quinone oxidoreductase subunit J [Candidatus Caenarcaniphilales bacterium]|nr:NADH-quinone oxidoreductase subunit J [Candidatus Caenarcaniphilales bacterium]